MVTPALDKQAQAELTAARMRNCTNQALDGLERILKQDTEDRANDRRLFAFQDAAETRAKGAHKPDWWPRCSS